MLGELSVGGGKYRLSKSGIAFATKIRKKQGTLFHTIPKEVCLGCDLKKGQEIINYLVYYGDGKVGLFIPLENYAESIINPD